MKKLLSLLLAMMLITTSVLAVADAGSEPDWTGYDALIAQIKTTTDTAEREALMHQAEDMLMATNCLVPIYYYNDIYLLKTGVEGLYSSPYGTKYFQYVTNGDATELSLNLASEPDKLDPALNSSVDGACLATAAFGCLYT